MTKLTLSFLAAAIAFSALAPLNISAGQRRKAVVRRPVVVTRRPVVVNRRPIVHTRLVVHRRHPIRRVLPTTVVVRPARKTVVVGAPLVYLPPVVWTPIVVTNPTRDRIVWEDNDVITRDEGWVDSNFGIDDTGNALFIDITGTTALNFAEVTFGNGNVQVVDFNEQPRGPGFYKFLDFKDGRHVKTVRVLAKSESDETKLAVYLSK